MTDLGISTCRSSGMRGFQILLGKAGGHQYIEAISSVSSATGTEAFNLFLGGSKLLLSKSNHPDTCQKMVWLGTTCIDCHKKQLLMQ